MRLSSSTVALAAAATAAAAAAATVSAAAVSTAAVSAATVSAATASAAAVSAAALSAVSAAAGTLPAVQDWPYSGPELCVIPATAPIRPHDTCADFASTSFSAATSDSPTLGVEMMRGEVESAQLLLRQGAFPPAAVGSGNITNVTVSFEGDIAKLVQFDVFQVGFVNTRSTPRYGGSGGGWRSDPLLPGQGFGTPGDVATGIWIDVTAPRTAQPGNYTGQVVVSGDVEGANFQIAVPTSLEIWDLTVPLLNESTIGTAWSGSWDANHFATYYPGIDWNTTKYKWFDFFLQHRIPPDEIYSGTFRDEAELEYLISKGVRRFALVDVNSFLAAESHRGKMIVEPGASDATAPMRSTVNGPYHAHGLHASLQPDGSCTNYTESQVQTLVQALQPVVTYLESRQALDAGYVYGWDENPPDCEPQIRQVYGAVKAAYPNLTTVATLNWPSMPADMPVDVWVLQYQMLDPAAAQNWTSTGKTQWQYHCISPSSLTYLNTFIERPGLQDRLLFWLAAKNEVEVGAPNGWLYYAVDLWRPCDAAACGGPIVPKIMERIGGFGPFTDFDPANYIWEPQYYDIFANGDGSFVYPCADEMPCGTTRLSNIRDGMEDWELAHLVVGEASKVRAAELLGQMVRSPSEWTSDASLLRETRQQLAALAMESRAVLM